MKIIRQDIQTYIECEILPRYDNFDAAHRRDHAEMVIRQSLELAEQTGADAEMAYVIAAYHDTGLCEGREQHHLVSGRIIRADQNLLCWFSPEQIETMACAVEDHRASADHAPRTLYGRIVAEADRFIDPETIVRRTVQFGLEHYPELDKAGHYERTVQHLREKYGRSGYLKLWFTDSPNAKRLELLRQIIDKEPQLRQLFNEYWEKLKNG
ncbi:MAG: HD domain-containing protein [Bacteroidales bacterium]|nr:HD domain-containing protein [Bacteroidales bacterium]